MNERVQAVVAAYGDLNILERAHVLVAITAPPPTPPQAEPAKRKIGRPPGSRSKPRAAGMQDPLPLSE